MQECSGTEQIAWGGCGIFIARHFQEQVQQTSVRNDLGIIDPALGQRAGGAPARSPAAQFPPSLIRQAELISLGLL